MNGLLASAPVYYALVQIRFEPVASMAKYVNELQDRLRKSGFPLYETEQTHALSFFSAQNGDLTVPPVGVPMPMANTTPIWYFTSSDRSRGYVLSNDFVTFQVTKYEGHELFFKELLAGFQLVNEVVSLGNITRVGMRYLDAIIPKEEESIKDYLHSSVLGIEFGTDWLGGSWESAYKTKHGLLIAKVYRAANAPVGTPIDLQIKNLQLPERFRSNTPVRHAVMDLDHYSDGTLPPDTKALAESLNYLHEGVSDFFKALVTEHALERWK